MFTLNNHLKYTIDDRLYGFRKNSFESYKVMVGRIDQDQYKKSSYQKELLRTADSVYQEFGKDLVVFLSGGTDSEIALRSFLDIGFKPKCAIIAFKGGYNSSDVMGAVDLAKSLEVPYEILHFDVKNFMRSGEASDFGKKLQCTQVTYLTVYYHILKLGFPAVMGGELLLKRNTQLDESKWYYCLRENEDGSAMRFTNLYNLPLVNEYFSYTPELMLYYLEHPDIIKLVTTKYNYKLSSVSSKNNILRKLCPAVEKRVKTHGYENLLGFNFESYRKLASEQIARLESSLDGIYYDEVIGMLKGQI